MPTGLQETGPFGTPFVAPRILRAGYAAFYPGILCRGLAAFHHPYFRASGVMFSSTRFPSRWMTTFTGTPIFTESSAYV